MHHDYPDILALTDKAPLWYDMNGVPRFAPFTPELCPSIYARTVALLEIACQWCGRTFRVEVHDVCYNDNDDPRYFHYGDPPRHDCVGDSMNCIDLAVLEAWRHVITYYIENDVLWMRCVELEGSIDHEEYVEE